MELRRAAKEILLVEIDKSKDTANKEVISQTLSIFKANFPPLRATIFYRLLEKYRDHVL